MMALKLELSMNQQIENEEIKENDQQIQINKIIEDIKAQQEIEFSQEKKPDKQQFKIQKQQNSPFLYNKRNIKKANNSQQLIQQVHNYFHKEQYTKKLISQKTGLSYVQINKILKCKEDQKELVDPNKRKKFRQFNFYIKQFILDLIKQNEQIIVSSYIKKQLFKKYEKSFTKKTICKFLKEELNLRFKRIHQLQFRTNFSDSKLQRQIAASNYIKNLYEGKHIINIDESIFQFTDQRNKSWSSKLKQCYQYSSLRLGNTNIICGVSSKGYYYYTVNYGQTNSLSIYYYLLKLVGYLENEDKNWRNNTIFLLDNAQYHRSTYLMKKYELLKIPIAFLGPYHFKIASIERVFSYIKTFDLNPNDLALYQKDKNIEYIRELAYLISQMDFSFIQSIFKHCIASALNDICLINI